MKKKNVCMVVIAATLIVGLVGCAKANKDYDVYFFNGKSEIAESLQNVSQKYEEETGKKVKIFTVGTAEKSETLRSEIKSKEYPTVFASNAVDVEEWKSAGYALDASEVQSEALKALYESVPDSMRLQYNQEGNYGVPYNIEGYGLIANMRLIMELLQLDAVEDFKEDYKKADYKEFQTMVETLDQYIKKEIGGTFTLNGRSYTVRNNKTPSTESLTGVFAIAGAEKWTYGNHYGNYPISAVYQSVYDVKDSKPEKAKQLKTPLIKSLEELEFASRYAAGADGAIKRGPQFINSTVTGYDQAIQMIAESKAIFIKNGNWIYSNVEKISPETAKDLTMLPVKVSLADEDITVKGLDAEKMNRSIPEFVSQYYVINAKATKEERKEAEDFVYWMNTSKTGQDFMIKEFAFVPFNADEHTVLENPLSNDLIEYKIKGDLLANPFDAAPASWGLECYGKYIMEDLFTQEDMWSKKQMEEIADKCIDYWQFGMEEW